MKSKIALKCIYFFVLTVILFCLVFIIYDKAGRRKRDINQTFLSTYTIYYDNQDKECMEKPELFYKDDKYEYSLPCISSYDTYLLWDDGTKELVKSALENKKVDIESLESHGLKVEKDEI